MPGKPQPSELPPPREHREGGVRVLVNPECHPDVEDLMRLPAIVSQLEGRSTRQAGHPTCWVWNPPWDDGPGLMVRRYAHGGILGRLWGTLFPGAGRMEREFAVSRYAAAAGLPVPCPVALRVEQVFGPLVRAHYVNRLIPEARDLLALCRELPPENLSTSRKRRICRTVADVVAALHEAGILHADLNLQNILVRDPLGHPEAFIVDLDRACVFGELDLPQRMSNLVRLDRSVEKWPESRSAIGLTDRVAFMRAYLGRYSEWAEREEEIIRRHGSRHLRHRPWRKS